MNRFPGNGSRETLFSTYTKKEWNKVFQQWKKHSLLLRKNCKNQEKRIYLHESIFQPIHSGNFIWHSRHLYLEKWHFTMHSGLPYQYQIAWVYWLNFNLYRQMFWRSNNFIEWIFTFFLTFQTISKKDWVETPFFSFDHFS